MEKRVLNIEIDGKPLQVEEGSMIIEAADAAGLYIPRFCYHKKLSVAANCRMCLVDVEKMAKPAPACATPVTEGMRVSTKSQKTHDAQRGVMEFLLINHPLDCPICDQGGECQLQDLAVGYGKDVGRYAENKRIVKDKDLGPLIATDMTRCIHCTRCVRFGQEIAGLMELGATGRGEHMRIGTYIESAVTSELSGNMIDLCPVGALTSKPFRYSARPWELIDRPGVSPHDSVGSNLWVQTRRHTVMRVLPRENEAVNECWISDRDRYSYTALNRADRLTVPMIKLGGEWQQADWQTALEFAVGGLRKVKDAHGAEQLGALASPTATTEEHYLLQKLMRGLGSNNIDHRLRQRDFSDDANAPAFPWLGQTIADLEHVDAALLVGSNIRQDQPLLGHRLRQASLRGAQLMAINPIDYEFTFGLAAKVIAPPARMVVSLARTAKALAALAGERVPNEVAAAAGSAEPNEQEQAMAQTLRNSKRATVLLGNFAASHPQASALRAIAQYLAELSGAALGHLAEANSVGGWWAGCVPHRSAAGKAIAKPGMNAYTMLESPRKAYIVFGAEPELDCWDGERARAALDTAEFVVAFCAFKDSANAYADVLLPLAPFTETAGTYVNCEGRWQDFPEAVPAQGDARPGWKILRVMGNLLNLPGFDYTSAEEVREEVRREACTPSAKLRQWQLAVPAVADGDLVRINDVPMYVVDPIVRRAEPLQRADTVKAAVRLNAAQAAKLGLSAGAPVEIHAGESRVLLDVVIDARIPDGAVFIPAGYRETATLGGCGPVRLLKVSAQGVA